MSLARTVWTTVLIRPRNPSGAGAGTGRPRWRRKVLRGDGPCRLLSPDPSTPSSLCEGRASKVFGLGKRLRSRSASSSAAAMCRASPFRHQTARHRLGGGRQRQHAATGTVEVVSRLGLSKDLNMRWTLFSDFGSVWDTDYPSGVTGAKDRPALVGWCGPSLGYGCRSAVFLLGQPCQRKTATRPKCSNSPLVHGSSSGVIRLPGLPVVPRFSAVAHCC